MKIRLFIILVLLFFSCSRKSKNTPEASVYDFLSSTDSLNLNFPDSLFPKRIDDIVLTKDYIYVLNLNFNTKYPLIKLDRRGNFIKIIGKIGGGPNEIKFLPFKISGYHDIIVAGSPTLNTLYVFKNDTLSKKRSFSSYQIKFSDLKILNENNIICTSYGETKYHLFLLDSNLNIKGKYIKMSKEPRLATLGGFLNFFAISGSDKNIYSHHCYPPHIYKIKFYEHNNKLSVSNVDYGESLLSKYTRPNYEEILHDYQKGKLRKIDIFKKFSRVHLIYVEDNYLLGIYLTSFGKYAKKYAFILKNNHIIKEVQIPNSNTKGLFVYDNGIARSIYYNENDVLKVKIKFFKLNKRYIDDM